MLFPLQSRGLLPDLVLVVLKGSWPGEAASPSSEEPGGLWGHVCVALLVPHELSGHHSRRECRVRPRWPGTNWEERQRPCPHPCLPSTSAGTGTLERRQASQPARGPLSNLCRCSRLWLSCPGQSHVGPSTASHLPPRPRPEVRMRVENHQKTPILIPRN